MTAVDRLQEGQLVGRYRIARLIGQGGMGAVYEAVHPGLKKRVAVKVLLPWFAEKPEARQRFLREGEAASRISHPNVVSVFDVGEDDGGPYLVMEYLQGRTLDDFLSERGALDVADALELFLPIMSAVAAGHDCGVVHRDLKPDNIFLAQGRRGELVPKVLDFGVSKLVDHDGPQVTRTKTMLGTSSYMSPEQARGAREVDARSDQYTLGLILYEMLTGRRAHRGENDLEILHNAAIGAIQPAKAIRAGLPDEVYLLLDRMMATSPSDRYPSVIDSARILLPLASEDTRTAVARDFTASAPAAVTGEIDASKGRALPAAGSDLAAEGTPKAASPGSWPRTLILPPTDPIADAFEDPLGDDRGDSVADALSDELDDDRDEVLADALTDDARAASLDRALDEALTDDRLEDTTLRHAAIESTPARTSPRPLRPAARVAAAVATAAVALVALIAWRAGRTEVHAPEAASVRPSAAPRPPQAPPPSSPSAATSAQAPVASAGRPAHGAAPFEIRAFPPEAEIVLDGRQPVLGRLEMMLPFEGSSHELRVSAPGYASRTIPLGADQPPPAEIHLDRVAPSPAQRGGAKKVRRGERAASARRGTNNTLILK